MRVREEFVSFRGLPVLLQCIGRDVKEKPHDLLLFIPGNPGGVHFYTDFCKDLYTSLNKGRDRELSIWILGHSGIHPSPDGGIPPLSGNEDSYGLQGQILQKQEFVETYVPEGSNLYLCGHSIGAKMALETLRYIQDKRKDLNLKYFYGLFPVIERMKETPAGPRHSLLFSELRPLLLWLAYFLSFMPSFILSWILSALLLPKGTRPSVLAATLQLFDPRILEKILYLGFTELRDVGTLDKTHDMGLLRENHERIRFYYGSNDQWCPKKYCLELKRDLPELQAFICQKDIPHAFTLGEEKGMSKVLEGWIRETL
eukprot:TRINITY_DN6135_c0_g1_i1.p1 TRINITY_DN6135_c0_g1~~TRINITY_DN6135_c0_g1_i1.p1  ORF type:complete len:314 (-),score=56.00 TRINITY_DN6135_c0_g1_i1:85-1026(-)